MAPAAVPPVGAAGSFTVAEHSAPLVAPCVVGLPFTSTPSSNAGPTGGSAAVLLPLGSQTSRAVPSHSPPLAFLETTALISASPSRKLATVERQRHAACRDLAAATVELHKMKDENDEQRSSLAARRDAFQMLRPPLESFMS